MKITSIISTFVQLYRKPLQSFIKNKLGFCGNDVVISLPCKMSVPQNVFMKDHTLIQPNVTFIMNKGKVFVGKWSVIASNCIIITDNHVPTVGVNHRMLGRYHVNDKVKDIVLEDDCWAGAGVILMNGAKLGRGAIAAAGALVNKEVPPYAVVAGVPARIIGSVFSIDQILEHEKYLYPEHERMSRLELENLFLKYFDGKKSIGSSDLSEIGLSLIREHADMQYAVK